MKHRTFTTLILLIFLILLLFMLTLLFKKEHFEKKIDLGEWSSPENDKLFQDLFRDVDKNVIVYETFHKRDMSNYQGAIRVQVTGESFFDDPEQFDINFIPVAEESKNVIIFPFASHYTLTNNIIDKNSLLVKRELTKNKSSFCLFASSHDGCKARNDFFAELSKYKQVDSCGRYMNNITCPGSWGTQDYIEFMNDYKFMICFENKSQPNYFTEKLINAYCGGVIPIYWGCPNIHDYVNMDSILYLKPDYNDNDFQELLKQVAELDNNADAYKIKYQTVFFKNGVIPDAFNIDSLRQKINDRLVKQ
uniref:Fucosyltransferase C-terminal domain-containing protein n=1 Tax=viral metagenome TaxID=1070528 RepID=A0A6C0B2X6_9ZZZZ